MRRHSASRFISVLRTIKGFQRESTVPRPSRHGTILGGPGFVIAAPANAPRRTRATCQYRARPPRTSRRCRDRSIRATRSSPPLLVPARLLGLRLQIDAIGQPFVQELDRLLANAVTLKTDHAPAGSEKKSLFDKFITSRRIGAASHGLATRAGGPAPC
jgi:hypothetical protein